MLLSLSASTICLCPKDDPGGCPACSRGKLHHLPPYSHIDGTGLHAIVAYVWPDDLGQVRNFFCLLLCMSSHIPWVSSDLLYVSCFVGTSTRRDGIPGKQGQHLGGHCFCSLLPSKYPLPTLLIPFLPLNQLHLTCRLPVSWNKTRLSAFSLWLCSI